MATMSLYFIVNSKVTVHFQNAKCQFTFVIHLLEQQTRMWDSAGDHSKPRVVVLGGCGFIGRNLVEYLINNDLVSWLRVVDKTPPQLAFLNPTHTKAFEDPRVEYKSANLINPASCASALEPAPSQPWELVVNCAGETRLGQTEAVYEEGIYTLSVNVARRCALLNVRLVEISSGCMYSSDKPQNEDCPVEPWTTEARMKSRVERELRDMDLDYTIIRPGIVYGVGDRRSLTPRLLYGAVYRHLGETMRLLWTSSLRTHTLHVRDLARAAWLLGRAPAASRRLYHAVDDGDSSQGRLADLVADLFGIRHDYYGTAVSALAKSDIASVAEEANDKHLTAWADICRKYSVPHTPLEPSTAADLLSNRQLCLDGSRLRALLGPLLHPAPTREALREVLEDYAAMNLFPKELLL